jgi:hypothetical protein
VSTEFPDLDALLDRASDSASFERWLELARSTGWCERPVRLAGATHQIDPATGEVYSSYSTDAEPNGHLLKACGTRRATVCEPCSARYRADAWHLIVAGLRGGKGVPEDASTHPILFVTLTAPSFGPVHSRREGSGSARRCHPNRSEKCDHGHPILCHEAHEPDDARLGEPLCVDCFDFERAILWNAHATELWRRTTIGIQRELAKAMGCSRFADDARLSYAKVVEYQDRGSFTSTSSSASTGQPDRQSPHQPNSPPTISRRQSSVRAGGSMSSIPQHWGLPAKFDGASRSTSGESPSNPRPRAQWRLTSPSTPPSRPMPSVVSTIASTSRTWRRSIFDHT